MVFVTKMTVDKAAESFNSAQRDYKTQTLLKQEKTSISQCISSFDKLLISLSLGEKQSPLYVKQDKICKKFCRKNMTHRSS